jgi:hypothetical protein
VCGVDALNPVGKCGGNAALAQRTLLCACKGKKYRLKNTSTQYPCAFSSSFGWKSA